MGAHDLAAVKARGEHMGRGPSAGSWGCLLSAVLLGACSESPRLESNPPAGEEIGVVVTEPSPVPATPPAPSEPTPPETTTPSEPPPPASAVKWLRVLPGSPWPNFSPVTGSEDFIVQGALTPGATGFTLNRLDGQGEIVWTRSHPQGEGGLSHVAADGSIYLLRSSTCGDDYHGPGSCEDVVDFGGGRLYASGVVKLDAKGDFLWQHPIMSIASALTVNAAGEAAVTSYFSNYAEGKALTRLSAQGQVRWTGGGYGLSHARVLDDGRIWTTLEDGCRGPYGDEVGFFLCGFSADRTLVSQRALPGFPEDLLPQPDGSLVMRLTYYNSLSWGDKELPGSCTPPERCVFSVGLVALSPEGTPSWAVRLPSEYYPTYHLEGRNIWSITCPTDDQKAWCARVVRRGTDGSVHEQKPLASPEWSNGPDKVLFHQVTRLPGGDLLLGGAFQGKVEIAGRTLFSEQLSGFLLRVTPEDLTP